MLRDSVVVRTRPRGKTAAHDNHVKINSWVSFSLCGYGAPLGGAWGHWSSAIMRKDLSLLIRGREQEGCPS